MNEQMAEGLAAYRAKIEAGEIDPPVVGDQWTRFAERNTRKTAIDAMCVRCMGWDRDGERPPGARTDDGCAPRRFDGERRARNARQVMGSATLQGRGSDGLEGLKWA